MAARLPGKSCTRKVSFLNSSSIHALLSTASGSNEPYFGRPRPPKTNEPRSIQNRLAVAIHYATTAFSDPTRADAVAALGEITGPITLQRLALQMKRDPVGKRILEDRPIVSKATIPYDRFIREAPADNVDGKNVTFGQAYGFFLKSHDFDPDERDDVRFVEDEEQAYIMLRYRQVRLLSLSLWGERCLIYVVSSYLQ
jgi:ubiquinone biosynthesis protein COQ4